VGLSAVIAMILSASMVCTSPHGHVTVTGSGTLSVVISANTVMRTPHLQRKGDAFGDIGVFTIHLNVPLRYQTETHYVDVNGPVRYRTETDCWVFAAWNGRSRLLNLLNSKQEPGG